jgi:hypothetical protein
MDKQIKYTDQLQELYKSYTGKELEVVLGVTIRSIQNYLKQENPAIPGKEVVNKIREAYANHMEGKPLGGDQLNESMFGNQSILNLAESNRMLAESNKRMVDSILEKITLLDYIKTNLDKLPDSMVRLTGTAVEKQAEATQLLLNEFEAIKRLITDASTSGHKKPLRNQKH